MLLLDRWWAGVGRPACWGQGVGDGAPWPDARPDIGTVPVGSPGLALADVVVSRSLDVDYKGEQRCVAWMGQGGQAGDGTAWVVFGS